MNTMGKLEIIVEEPKQPEAIKLCRIPDGAYFVFVNDDKPNALHLKIEGHRSHYDAGPLYYCVSLLDGTLNNSQEGGYWHSLVYIVEVSIHAKLVLPK